MVIPILWKIALDSTYSYQNRYRDFRESPVNIIENKGIYED